MKKALAVLMALALVLAMAACGNNPIPTKAPTNAETQAPAPSETQKPAETTAEVKPAETTPEETAPAETTPEETKAPETTPEATTEPETTPAETTPEETTPAETTPAETEPAETTPADTQPVDADKADYYANHYLGTEDMKPRSGNLRATMLANDEALYSMAYGTGVLVMESKDGMIELYQKDKLLYAHILLKPADGSEGEESWKVCQIPEEENPFENFGSMSAEELFEGAEESSAVMTYQRSYMEDGVEYDVVLAVPPEDEMDPDEPMEMIMTILADTHEVVSMEVVMSDPENPDVKQTQKMEFLEEDALAMPENIQAEEAPYEETLMTLFMAMMSLMSSTGLLD